MTDVMQDFKDKRFKIIEYDLFPENPNIIVLLVDFRFWDEHFDELSDWCNSYDSQIRGMTVDIPDEETLSLFCLKWS